MTKIYVVLISIMLFSGINVKAQMGGGYNPDSLNTIIAEGIITIDTTSMHTIYYLDVIHDGITRYTLNFGPFWYEPRNSDAERPRDGDSVTIKGGINDPINHPDSVLMVYEINNKFWRDPYNPFWNNMGKMQQNGGMMDTCYNSGFGWRHDSLLSISVAGTVLVDSTFKMLQYYLDTDNDSIPEFFLNFGPPWYTPVSGALRPHSGDKAAVTGGLLQNGDPSMLIVYKLNEQVWRDSASFMGNMGGGWIKRDMSQSMKFHNPFDTTDWIEMNPGWYSMTYSMHDSLFCQIFEILPGRINTLGDENALAAYEIDFFYPQMMGGGMQMGMGCGGHMQFENAGKIQLHYTDEQLNLYNISEMSLIVKYWNSDVDQWLMITNSTIDSSLNTISFAASKIGNFYIIEGSSPTGLNENPAAVKEFYLEQNYPNPFNPATLIRWQSPEAARVSIKIYDIVGREIATLIDEFRQPGKYETEFNAVNLPSGVYFYRFRAGEYQETKKMILMK